MVVGGLCCCKNCDRFEVCALLSAVPFWILYVSQALAGENWFYRDASALPLPWLLGVAGAAVIIFLTPVLFDQTVTWSIGKLFGQRYSLWGTIARES